MPKRLSNVNSKARRPSHATGSGRLRVTTGDSIGDVKTWLLQVLFIVVGGLR